MAAVGLRLSIAEMIIPRNLGKGGLRMPWSKRVE